MSTMTATTTQAPTTPRPTPVAPRVRFDGGDQALQQELRERVDAWFAATGQKKTANGAMVAKTAFFLLLAVALYAVLVSGALPALVAWPLAALFGVVMAGVGFNVGHDAIHGAWSDDARVNRLLSLSFDVLGASSLTWAEAHNFVHHTYTNVAGVDHDLEPGPFLIFNPERRPSIVHRFQHLYAFPLYALTFLVWVFKKDFVQVFSPDPRTGQRHTPRDIAFVVGFKLVHLALFVGVPLLVSGYGPLAVVIGYLTMVAAAGLTLAVVFQLAHVVEGTLFPVPDAERRLPRSWAEHQLRTTADFATDSAFWNFFTGGLNHQVEHHLFYKICHIHYPALAPLVRDVARRHGVPYLAHRSFSDALASHVRTLRRLGRAAPAPSSTTASTTAPTTTTATTATATPRAA